METSEKHQDEQREVEGLVPPGRQLRQARESRDLSVPEVASALRLSVSSVENLEQDRYDRLPPDTFVRGYLRSYANLLDLPAEPLLEAFRQANGIPAPRPLRARKPVQTAPDLSLGMKRFLPIGAGLVVAVIAGAWGLEIYRDMGVPSSPRESAIAPVEESRRIVAEAQAERDSRPDFRPRAGGDTTAREVRDPLPSGRGSASPPDTVRRPEPEAAASAEPTAARVTWQPQVVSQIQALEDGLAAIPDEEGVTVDGGDDDGAMAEEERESGGKRLVLRFTGPSWVEVHDAEGERLLYELISEGGRRSLSGTPPYSLVIGDVGHVSVELDGEAVDLGDRRPGRVARLQIPR